MECFQARSKHPGPGTVVVTECFQGGVSAVMRMAVDATKKRWWPSNLHVSESTKEEVVKA